MLSNQIMALRGSLRTCHVLASNLALEGNKTIIILTAHEQLHRIPINSHLFKAQTKREKYISHSSAINIKPFVSGINA